MFKTVPGVLVLSIPESKIHIIDVSTSLGNDNQLQVTIAVCASVQHSQGVRSSAKYDRVSRGCLGQDPELRNVCSPEAGMFAPNDQTRRGRAAQAKLRCNEPRSGNLIDRNPLVFRARLN